MRGRSRFLLGLLFCALFVVSFCFANDKTVKVVGKGECADCKENDIKSSQAFSGLRVSVDCKLKNGEFKRRGSAELDAEGEFEVAVPEEILKDGKLNEECYVQLHSATATPCPAHNGLAASKVVDHGTLTFGPAESVKFSSALCASKFLWPFFKHPPLPPLPPFHHPWFNHPPLPFPPIWKKPFPPIWKKPLPPPVPVYQPAPNPPTVPVVKPLPPPVPVYTPKPLPPPVPAYIPPVYKPKPPVPIYKPPVYTPKPPVYTPKPPVPIYKPPVYKPKPIPPPVPIYKPPVFYPKPPLPFKKPPCPPFSKIPHPPISFPPLPPH